MQREGSKPGLLVGVAVFSLLALFLAACGGSDNSATASNANAGATPTATCPPNRFKNTTGTIQSVTNTSLVVHSSQGSDVQANYASNTRIQRQATVASSALKSGTSATITVKQDTSGNYTATRIQLLGNRANNNGNPGNGGGFGNGTGNPNRGNGGTGRANCLRQGRNNNGAFGGNAGNGGTSNARALVGTLGQLTNNTLTVTDFQGANYTVTVDSSTKISQIQSATAGDLKNGENVTLTGTADSKGIITAQSITIS